MKRRTKKLPTTHRDIESFSAADLVEELKRRCTDKREAMDDAAEQLETIEEALDEIDVLDLDLD